MTVQTLKHIPIAIALCMMALAAHAGEKFAHSVADLPVMAQLHEDLEATMVFDKPSGRLVEWVAQGPVSAEQVLLYYGKVLPALGWSRRSAKKFIREGEILELFIDDAREVVHVRITIAPE